MILFYLIVALVAVELFLRLPLISIVRELIAYLNRTRKVISSDYISDHWKEKALLAYAERIALSSVKLAAFFLCILFALYLISLAFDMAASHSISHLEELMTLGGVGVTTLFAVLYYVVRGRIVRQ